MPGPAVVFAIALSTFIGAVLSASLLLDGHGSRVMTVPTGIGAATVLLAWLAIRRARREHVDNTQGWPWREPVHLVAVLPLVLVFGIVPGTGIHIAGYAWLHGVRPGTALLAGAGASASIHLAIVALLGARLYPGLLAGMV